MYFLYRIKGTVFHRSLVCFYVVIQFIITVSNGHWYVGIALVRSLNRSTRSPTQSQTQDQVSRHRLCKVEYMKDQSIKKY